ncbi:MAG: thiamine pyrophosphate-binding protein [Actinobacteria bacterium]|nr:thiamine pyrophosphate-binding protein [Actinomycetota bacterium]
MLNSRLKRAKEIKESGNVRAAVYGGKLKQFDDVTLSEALVLGLLNQGVSKYIGVFGHGSIDLGEVLRIYEESGLVKMFNVRHEVEAAHCATMLKWHYNETSAVVTSIGPGALHAFAGSLSSASNGIGVYHIYADATTHDEGPNMQQIPKREQDLFGRLTNLMGKSYTLHTPESVFTALRLGQATVFNPYFASPFYFLLPMNIQPAVINNLNFLELPEKADFPRSICSSEKAFKNAIQLIKSSKKMVIKAGRGAVGSGKEISLLADLIDAVIVTGPNVSGIVPYDNKRNMTVGGSKGSISGNYAMNEGDLIIVIGARGVCQWDCSGTAWENAKNIINFNSDTYDASHYNNSVQIIGDASENLKSFIRLLEEQGYKDRPEENISGWLKKNMKNKKKWDLYKLERYNNPVIYDKKFGKEILTQPAAIKIACDFAAKTGAIKYFDAGDVQANGFQIVEDSDLGQTYTDTGASYMGFAVSALLSGSIADNGKYCIAFTGDGSFMMNPQILIDAVQHKLRSMIIIFDNRAMSAITNLQVDQYKKDYKTDDNVEVDYVRLASAIKGVKGIYGGHNPDEFNKALEAAYGHDGLSVIHLVVYNGENKMGGLGAFGNWNIGIWCEDVQNLHHRLGF